MNTQGDSAQGLTSRKVYALEKCAVRPATNQPPRSRVELQCTQLAPPPLEWIRQDPSQNSVPGVVSLYSVQSVLGPDNCCYVVALVIDDAGKNSATRWLVYKLGASGTVIWQQVIGPTVPFAPDYSLQNIDIAIDPTTGTVCVVILYRFFGQIFTLLYRIDPISGLILASGIPVLRDNTAVLFPILLQITSQGYIYMAGTGSIPGDLNPYLEEYDTTFALLWSSPYTAYLGAIVNYLTLCPDGTPLVSLYVPVGPSYNAVLLRYTLNSPILAWALDDPLINTGRVYSVSCVPAPDVLLYLYSTVAAGFGTFFLASVSYTGVVLSVVPVPGLNVLGLSRYLSFTRNPTDRLFVAYTAVGDICGGTPPPPDVGWQIFAEILRDGNTVWSNQTPFYNPADQSRLTPNTSRDATHTLQATADELWMTYQTNGVVPGGTKSAVQYDSVVAKFQLEACTSVQIPVCCPLPTQRPDRTTVAESDYVLGKLSECTLILENGNRGAACDTATPSGVASRTPVFQAQAKPTDLRIERTHPRVRRIEDVARFARPRTSSGYTARLRAGLTNYKPQRHAEHYRATIPLPPCPVPFRGNPGVPIAPITPCNEGFQSVDYSNPRA